MKVWNIHLGRDRLVIVAKSQKRAVELLNERFKRYSLYSFRIYASETGNDTQLALAEHGEGVWIEVGRDYSNEYERLEVS